MADAWLWAMALGGLGLPIGSFAATVAVRYPASAIGGRSHCDGCGATLRAWELVPLLSWVALRGRCRRCGGTINRWHPAIEALALGMGAAAG